MLCNGVKVRYLDDGKRTAYKKSRVTHLRVGLPGMRGVVVLWPLVSIAAGLTADIVTYGSFLPCWDNGMRAIGTRSLSTGRHVVSRHRLSACLFRILRPIEWRTSGLKFLMKFNDKGTLVLRG